MQTKKEPIPWVDPIPAKIRIQATPTPTHLVVVPVPEPDPAKTGFVTPLVRSVQGPARARARDVLRRKQWIKLGLADIYR